MVREIVGEWTILRTFEWRQCCGFLLSSSHESLITVCSRSIAQITYDFPVGTERVTVQIAARFSGNFDISECPPTLWFQRQCPTRTAIHLIGRGRRQNATFRRIRDFITADTALLYDVLSWVVQFLCSHLKRGPFCRGGSRPGGERRKRRGGGL